MRSRFERLYDPQYAGWPGSERDGEIADCIDKIGNRIPTDVLLVWFDGRSPERRLCSLSSLKHVAQQDEHPLWNVSSHLFDWTAYKLPHVKLGNIKPIEH